MLVAHTAHPTCLTYWSCLLTFVDQNTGSQRAIAQYPAGVALPIGRATYIYWSDGPFWLESRVQECLPDTPKAARSFLYCEHLPLKAKAEWDSAPSAKEPLRWKTSTAALCKTLWTLSKALGIGLATYLLSWFVGMPDSRYQRLSTYMP